MDDILHRSTQKAKTYYICGNHDARYLKSLQNLNRELLTVMAERIDIWDFLIGNESDITPCPFWFQSFHNVTIGHPEQSSSIIMRSPAMMRDYLKNRGLQESSVWIMGHTHGFGKVVWNNDILIEGGSMCRSLDWQFGGRLHITQRKRSWVKGYVVIEFKDGHADWDSIQLKYLGVETWR